MAEIEAVHLPMFSSGRSVLFFKTPSPLKPKILSSAQSSFLSNPLFFYNEMQSEGVLCTFVGMNSFSPRAAEQAGHRRTQGGETGCFELG